MYGRSYSAGSAYGSSYSTGGGYGFGKASYAVGYAAVPASMTLPEPQLQWSYESQATRPSGVHASETVFDPSEFLNSRFQHPVFVGCTEDVKKVIEETYLQMTGLPLPPDVVIMIAPGKEISKHYPGPWSQNIAGFAINRVGKGVSEIYVKADTMDRVMLTVGHELGHVQSPPLPRLVDEEAKAYAFSLAWIETIKKFNIGGLSPCVMLDPARNGVHNVALDFVLDKITSETSPLSLFHQLACGLRSSAQPIE